MPAASDRRTVAVVGSDRLLLTAVVAAVAASDVLRQVTVADDPTGAALVVIAANGTEVTDLVAAARAGSPTARLLVLAGDARLADELASVDVVLGRDRTVAELLAHMVALLGLRAPIPPTPPRPAMPARQLEVLRLLVAGRTPQQIAIELGITTNTCRDHIRHARESLGCATALHAVMEAMRRGWLLPPAADVATFTDPGRA